MEGQPASPDKDSASEPELLPDEGDLEISFFPAGYRETSNPEPAVVLCPMCDEHVEPRPNGTCPLGHELP